MKLFEYPKLGERCWQEILPNGLCVRVVPKPGFARRYAFLGVNFGSIDTQFTLGGVRHRVPDGIAHYLEHKMFDLPEDNAMNLFAAHGGSPNAFTGYAMTAYYFDCTEEFEENLKILLRLVTEPYFTPESVEKERGIIAQEIRMYEDSAESRVVEDLFDGMFRSHPVRVPIAGTVESIAEITAQSLYDCHAAFYQPGNMVLCVAGDVDPETVVRIAREGTPAQPGVLPQRDYGAPEALSCPRSRMERTMEVAMPTFAIGFKCPPPESEPLRREIVGEIAAEILAGESSTLYQRLYEQGLIDAGFSVGYESVKDACLLSATGDSRDPEAVLQALLDEAARIVKEGFDRAQFDRLVRSAVGRRTRDLDSFESICYLMGGSYYFDGVDYLRFPEVYASVEPEDVQSFLTETVRPERAALSVVRPKEGEKIQ